MSTASRRDKPLFLPSARSPHAPARLQFSPTHATEPDQKSLSQQSDPCPYQVQVAFRRRPTETTTARRQHATCSNTFVQPKQGAKRLMVRADSGKDVCLSRPSTSPASGAPLTSSTSPSCPPQPSLVSLSVTQTSFSPSQRTRDDLAKRTLAPTLLLSVRRSSFESPRSTLRLPAARSSDPETDV